MKNGWYMVLAWALMSCTVEANDVEQLPQPDVEVGQDQAEDTGNSDAFPEDDMTEVHVDVAADLEEDAAVEVSWQSGDPAAGTGPFWPGTGRREFEPLMHGDDVRWERGTQGGHHIWIAAEVERAFIEELEADDLRQIRHTYEFIHEDGELLAKASRTGGFRFNEGAGEWRALGLYAVLEAPRRPSTMNDDLIRYVLQVEMEDGQQFQRELWLVSRCCD